LPDSHVGATYVGQCTGDDPDGLGAGDGLVGKGIEGVGMDGIATTGNGVGGGFCGKKGDRVRGVIGTVTGKGVGGVIAKGGSVGACIGVGVGT